ncbi:MAG: alpha/beta hydrolase [Acidobacteria bacterium]|nr:alpha/beta hydrolase [Acidobacteriota bacterium]
MRVLIGLLLAISAVACGSGATSATDRLHPCRIDEGPPDAFCGAYRVFEDRGARTGRTIDLKIVVAPALRRDPRPDPIFVFEGGPGGGAATLATQRIPMFRRFQTDRDIVLIDQRGTGGSNPLDCDQDDKPDDDPGLIDEHTVDRFRTCLQTLQADATRYTTSIAMDDIDDVRRFLGYDAINLWGGSYGTRAALVYLQRHEASVRAVVLDGVVPTDMRIPLYMARDGQRALDRMLDDCEKDTVGCASAYPGLRASTDALWAQLASKPRVTLPHPRTGAPLTITVSQQFAATVVLQALYTPEVSALLPRLLTDASRGDYKGLVALAFANDLPRGAISQGLFLSVVCAEDLPRIGAEDIARETAGRFIGRTLFETQVKPCEFWPRGLVDAEFYEPVRSPAPVLIFSGENDPVTPPVWGEHVHATLPNSRHIVVPGSGHITLMRGCVRQLVGRFFDAARVDAIDPACVNGLSRLPFFTTYTGAERRP